jgi:hypothetical protein
MNTDDSRKVLDDNIAAALRELAKSAAMIVSTGRRTCVNCLHFDEAAGVCTFYTPQMTPPPRVIAFGCGEFQDGVPF